MAVPPIPDLKLTGGAGGSAGPSDAQAATYGSSTFDGSGWNVNFSGSQNAGSNKAAIPSVSDLLGISGGVSPMLLIGGAAIVGLVLWKKFKSKA